MLKVLRNWGGLRLIPVVAWLFMQLAMTGMFLPASVSAGVGLAESGFPNTIVICTGSGFKRVVLNDDGSLPQDAPSQENYCPWCMRFDNLSSLAGPVIWQATPLVFAENILWISNRESCEGRRESVQFLSRAPPL